MEIFTVYAFDICTNTLIAILPANGLQYDRRLDEAGSCSFTLDLLGSQAALQVAPFLAYAGNPVGIYVDHNGSLEWGGWQTTWNYQHSTHTLQVQAKEWPDYFAHRLVARDYNISAYPYGVDPGTLVRDAVTDAQDPMLCGSAANVYVSVIIDPATLQIPRVIPNYTATQSTVGQVIGDATAGSAVGIGGLDVWTDVKWSAGAPSVTLRIDCPRAGRYVEDSGLAVNLLQALDFSWPSDVANSGTNFIITGAGSGQIQPSISTTAPGIVLGGLGGLPRMDKVISHSTTTSPAWLELLAAGDAQEFGGPINVPTVTLATDDPSAPLGSFDIGDDWRLFAGPFELYPNGVDQTWRCVAYAVTVPDDGGVPTVTLTYNTPPIF